MLVDALRLVALNASDQRAVLPAFVVAADEVALTFDDAYRLMDQLAEQGQLTTAQAAGMAAIETALTAMSDPGTDQSWIWSVAALDSDPRWISVRTSARALLAGLGVPEGFPAPPDVRYLDGAERVSRGSAAGVC
jgi:hypothetical protein